VKQGKTRTAGITLRLAAVAAIAAAIALAFTLSTTRSTAPSARIADGGATFAVRASLEPLTRSIRTIPISPLAQPVQLAPLTLPNPPPTPESQPAPAPPPPVTMTRDRSNVCERHGGYRVVYSKGHGVAWRCEFPKATTRETRG
jgi:hypothetical protein